jgi:hypothetical protein
VTAHLSAAKARSAVEAAVLAKAPDWPETRHWHVTSGGKVLVVVTPSYGGTGRSGRNGWTWWLASAGPGGKPGPYPTREQAAVAGLGAWERWATARTT